MILSDSEIIRRLELGDLKIESLGGYDIMNQIGPASLDMRLGNVFRFYKRDGLTLIDP
ncbi:MAG: dCTP deaminase, partial [Candidatus Gracilibacteria bacterium]|nr:dCTP deaminase [Candidatus Gracilibacteria bacterium]